MAESLEQHLEYNSTYCNLIAATQAVGGEYAHTVEQDSVRSTHILNVDKLCPCLKIRALAEPEYA